MSTQLEPRRALTPRWTKAQVQLLKRTVAKGLNDDQFLLFMYTCKRTGLDPFIKQIYAIPRFDNKTNEYVMTIQTGIDGLRLTADRTQKYAGSSKPVFDLDPNDPSRPAKANVTVYKIVEGEKCAFEGEARWSEFVQKNHKTGDLMGRWSDMPFNQLAKCAEAQALRKAFPAELSGILTHDESPVIDLTIIDEAGAAEEIKAPLTLAGVLYTGFLAGHVPNDPKKKTPHRLVIKLDQGAELILSTYDIPAVIKQPQKFMGRRVQVSYEEKPNPKGGEPFRNLKHFALEEHTPEPTHPPQKDAERGADITEPSKQQSLDASAANSHDDPAQPYRAGFARYHTPQDCKTYLESIPEEVRQDCHGAYTDRLKEIAPNAKKK